jgi:hypothetical protein
MRCDARHEYDHVMSYCMRCGIAMQDAFEQQSPECFASENVTAISHIVRGKRLARQIGEEYGQPIPR